MHIYPSFLSFYYKILTPIISPCPGTKEIEAVCGMHHLKFYRVPSILTFQLQQPTKDVLFHSLGQEGTRVKVHIGRVNCLGFFTLN